MACGILRVDRDDRNTLMYDLMECARGTVDGLVLAFLARTVLHAGDFARTQAGGCRLHPQLARAAVATCHVGQAEVDAPATWLASALVAVRCLPQT